MAIVLIPVTNDPESTVTTKLEGVVYKLHLRWNVRASAWYLDILDNDDNVLAASRKLVCEWPLTVLRDSDPTMPPGVLWCRDTQGQYTDPTLDDLGTRAVLYYEESA